MYSSTTSSLTSPPVLVASTATVVLPLRMDAVLREQG
jgi:hypothetical protein